MGGHLTLKFDDPSIKYATFFIVMGMPLTYSITDGLLLGSLVYLLTNIFLGKIRETSAAMLILALVGVMVFFIL